MWWVILLIGFLFLITYDPKSKTLDKYLPRAKGPSGRYQEIQFAERGAECPEVKTRGGAIISK